MPLTGYTWVWFGSCMRLSRTLDAAALQARWTYRRFRHPRIRGRWANARAFRKWLASPDGQRQADYADKRYPPQYVSDWLYRRVQCRLPFIFLAPDDEWPYAVGSEDEE